MGKPLNGRTDAIDWELYEQTEGWAARTEYDLAEFWGVPRLKRTHARADKEVLVAYMAAYRDGWDLLKELEAVSTERDLLKELVAAQTSSAKLTYEAPEVEYVLLRGGSTARSFSTVSNADVTPLQDAVAHPAYYDTYRWPEVWVTIDAPIRVEGTWLRQQVAAAVSTSTMKRAVELAEVHDPELAATLRKSLVQE